MQVLPGIVLAQIVFQRFAFPVVTDAAGDGGKIVEIAVIAERMAKCSPCGGCRQRLAEFTRPDTKLYLCDETGVAETVTMGEMLPYGFRGDILK